MSSRKKGEYQSVGDAIRDMLNAYRLENKFNEANLVDSWERLVGKPIAKRTRKLYIRNRVLYVEFDSPTMRNDFSLHKADVLALFRKEFGPHAIDEIVPM
jgi:predicted nucleic acid-binding Zn ribbon protein